MHRIVQLLAAGAALGTSGAAASTTRRAVGSSARLLSIRGGTTAAGPKDAQPVFGLEYFAN